MLLNKFTRAYTLVELLTVMSIIAILSAIFAPVIKTSFGAAYQFSAGQSLCQMGKALQTYAADYDDTYPLAMVSTEDGGFQTWFGYRDAKGKIDYTRGEMEGYLGKKRPSDPTASNYKDFFGDHSGFGYNWQSLGSDFSVTKDFSQFPDCSNAATSTQLQNPSKTVAFTTSVFVKAPWLQGGDSASYDFGFVSPPRDWNGNPNMDFRHMGDKQINAAAKTVTYSGNALVLWADGSMKPLKQRQVKDEMFDRSLPDVPAGDN